MAVDVPGWRARLLEMMREAGLPYEDAPRVLEALAAEAVTAEREACVNVVLETTIQGAMQRYRYQTNSEIADAIRNRQ